MRLRTASFALAGCLIAVSASAWPFPAGSNLPPWPTAFPSVMWPSLPTAIPTAIPTAVIPQLPTGAIARGPDYAVKPKAGAPKVTPYALATPHLKFAPDNKTVLMHAKIARIGSDTNGIGVLLGTTRPYRSAWAPDSKHVVLSSEDRSLTVWKAPSGALARKIDNAFGAGKYSGLEVGFPESNVVLFHDGCRLNRLDIASTAPHVPLGLGTLCGRVYVSRDGKRWVVLEEGSKSYGVGIWYVRASSIDTTTGVPKSFLDTTKVPSWTDVQISPTGDRLCFRKQDGRAGCVVIDTGVVEDVSDAPTDRLLVYSADGSKLLWADSASNKGLHVVDFTARTMRRIATVSSSSRSWHFFSGNGRVLAQGYDGATAFDLDQGWSLPIFTGGESESFFAIPGDPKRAFVGKASEASTNLFRVELPL